MALVRSIAPSKLQPGLNSMTDLHWSGSKRDGIQVLNLFSNGSDDRTHPKISQLYGLKPEIARELAHLILQHFPEPKP